MKQAVKKRDIASCLSPERTLRRIAGSKDECGAGSWKMRWELGDERCHHSLTWDEQHYPWAQGICRALDMVSNAQDALRNIRGYQE
jgi:hypothetical protein